MTKCNKEKCLFCYAVILVTQIVQLFLLNSYQTIDPVNYKNNVTLKCSYITFYLHELVQGLRQSSLRGKKKTRFKNIYKICPKLKI